MCRQAVLETADTEAPSAVSKWENVSRARGRLKAGPKWTKPESTTQCQALQDLLYLQGIGDVEVQRDWDLFMIGLNHCYHTGVEKALLLCSEDSVRLSCNNLLHQAKASKGRKGCTAKHQWINIAKPGTGSFADTEAQRKLNRRLARLSEALAQARKLVCRGEPVNPQLRDLCRKLWPPAASCVPSRPPEITAACRKDIAAAKAQPEHLRQHSQQAALKAWKERVQDPSLKGLSRWLSGKDQDQAAVNVYQGVAQTSDETCRKIVDHWQSVWREQRRDGQPTPTQIADRLVQDFGQVRHARWESVTVEDLSKAVKNASGLAGPDQWSSEELKFLPYEAIKLWHALSAAWLDK